MTDITELTQKRNAAISRLSRAFEPGHSSQSELDALSYTVDVMNELVEALEAKDADAEWVRKRIAELAKERETKEEQRANWFQMAQKLGEDLDAAEKRIAELESRTVTVKLPNPHAYLIWIQAGHAPDDFWDEVEVSHSEEDRCCDGAERYPVYARWEIEEMLTAAGIKVEAE